jgi:integrase
MQASFAGQSASLVYSKQSCHSHARWQLAPASAPFTDRQAAAKRVRAVPELRQPVALFLGLTGCRFSEIAAQRVDDVVQTPHGLGVRVHGVTTQSKRSSAAVFGPTKTHQTRTVPVPAALDGYVRHRVATTAPGGFLFPSPTGAVWTNTNFRARSR